jgi:hypothetical protein
MMENDRLKEKIKEQNDYIKKLETELIETRTRMMNMSKNADILQGSLVNKEVEVNKLKSKAYGYDINKKLEYQQQRVKPYGNNNYGEDDYGLWENENRNNNNNLKLDQLAKEKQLWIGNPSQNIEKLVNEMDKNYKAHEEFSQNPTNQSNYRDNNINSNLRKYSPLILDQPVNSKQNFAYRNNKY